MHSKDFLSQIDANGYDCHDFPFGYVDEKNLLPIVSPVYAAVQVVRHSARSGRGSPLHSLTVTKLLRVLSRHDCLVFLFGS